jgi:hypothetical protein
MCNPACATALLKAPINTNGTQMATTSVNAAPV